MLYMAVKNALAASPCPVAGLMARVRAIVGNETETEGEEPGSRGLGIGPRGWEPGQTRQA